MGKYSFKKISLNLGENSKNLLFETRPALLPVSSHRFLLQDFISGILLLIRVAKKKGLPVPLDPSATTVLPWQRWTAGIYFLALC